MAHDSSIENEVLLILVMGHTERRGNLQRSLQSAVSISSSHSSANKSISELPSSIFSQSLILENFPQAISNRPPYPTMSQVIRFGLALTVICAPSWITRLGPWSGNLELWCLGSDCNYQHRREHCRDWLHRCLIRNLHHRRSPRHSHNYRSKHSRCY